MPTPRKLRVAVVFGGRSAEHEISLLSARFVVASLDPERFEPVLVGIDKSGRWLLQEEALLLGAARDPRLVRLNQAMPDVTLAAHPAPGGEASLAIGGQGPAGIDVVFPVLHGPLGEDGAIQGLLEPQPGAALRGRGGARIGGGDGHGRAEAAARRGRAPPLALGDAAGRGLKDADLDRCEALGYPLFVKPRQHGLVGGRAPRPDAGRSWRPR